MVGSSITRVGADQPAESGREALPHLLGFRDLGVGDEPRELEAVGDAGTERRPVALDHRAEAAPGLAPLQAAVRPVQRLESLRRGLDETGLPERALDAP